MTEYRIKSDENQWTLCRMKRREKGKNVGAEWLEPVSYHPNLQRLSEALGDRILRDRCPEGGWTFEQLQAAVESLREEIVRVATPVPAAMLAEEPVS